MASLMSYGLGLLIAVLAFEVALVGGVPTSAALVDSEQASRERDITARLPRGYYVRDGRTNLPVGTYSLYERPQQVQVDDAGVVEQREQRGLNASAGERNWFLNRRDLPAHWPSLGWTGFDGLPELAEGDEFVRNTTVYSPIEGLDLHKRKKGDDNKDKDKEKDAPLTHHDLALIKSKLETDFGSKAYLPGYPDFRGFPELPLYKTPMEFPGPAHFLYREASIPSRVRGYLDDLADRTSFLEEPAKILPGTAELKYVKRLVDISSDAAANVFMDNINADDGARSQLNMLVQAAQDPTLSDEFRFVKRQMSPPEWVMGAIPAVGGVVRTIGEIVSVVRLLQAKPPPPGDCEFARSSRWYTAAVCAVQLSYGKPWYNLSVMPTGQFSKGWVQGVLDNIRRQCGRGTKIHMFEPAWYHFSENVYMRVALEGRVYYGFFFSFRLQQWVDADLSSRCITSAIKEASCGVDLDFGDHGGCYYVDDAPTSGPDKLPH